MLGCSLPRRRVRGAYELTGHAVKRDSNRRLHVEQRNDRPAVVADRIDVVATEVAGLIAVLIEFANAYRASTVIRPPAEPKDE